MSDAAGSNITAVRTFARRTSHHPGPSIMWPWHSRPGNSTRFGDATIKLSTEWFATTAVACTLLLRRIEGFSAEQASKILDLTVTHIGVLLHRARAGCEPVWTARVGGRVRDENDEVPRYRRWSRAARCLTCRFAHAWASGCTCPCVSTAGGAGDSCAYSIVPSARSWLDSNAKRPPTSSSESQTG